MLTDRQTNAPPPPPPPTSRDDCKKVIEDSTRGFYTCC